ncbi:iron-siderophore ABC transporter substrate-binding protein [Leptolyngbya sp. 7M]|uniref:iron-siderophore ABC transporter substrate-binding protein n=1 Tax=Leptolyngbya sp. 7M TaxID=2812896 RepID=UPI001B8C62F2|nr:iron-siderophore ABC transporter substrate-binding protein [Leptolyngbya sp. 7M]QYO67461.1 iron-siderophore ABC transporter substrate-binding protein [Leptolyngbya sp. 7M]
MGYTSQPNLEKILSLKPDLILGLTEAERVYQQLTQIAPTILFNFESSRQWKDILMHNAETLGRTDPATGLMAAYSDRLENLKTQINSRSQPLEVSVIRIYPNTISIYTSDSFIGSILDDAGLARPSVQNQLGQLDVSKETLHLADGDVIFLWSSELGQVQQEVQTKLPNLKPIHFGSGLMLFSKDRFMKCPVIGLAPASLRLML